MEAPGFGSLAVGYTHLPSTASDFKTIELFDDHRPLENSYTSLASHLQVTGLPSPSPFTLRIAISCSKLPTLVSGTQISAPAMVWCRQCLLCSRDSLCRLSAASPRQRLASDFVGGVQLPTGSFLTPRLS